ncbi:MAG: acyltransferase [bacterium]|nr:acyltransferase [bacterium]
MFSVLKRIIWDLKDPIGRFNYRSVLWRNFPGKAGQLVRDKHIPKYFAEAGRNISIHEGVRFRNIHRLRVGDNCEIGVDNFLQAGGGITLGERVMLGPGVKIWSVNHNFTDLDIPINQQGYTEEGVFIGDGCWLGANVFVFPGVNLPEGCVVSAGSVVAKKRYPPFSILAGYPARVIGNRKPKVEKTESIPEKTK